MSRGWYPPTPQHGIQWDTVGKQVVRILLQCVLVHNRATIPGIVEGPYTVIVCPSVQLGLTMVLFPYLLVQHHENGRVRGEVK